jgi:hypothetical protein
MAGAENQAITQDANEAALQEFEAGVRRSIKQADAGLVKTFKTKEEFLNHLEKERTRDLRRFPPIRTLSHLHRIRPPKA